MSPSHVARVGFSQESEQLMLFGDMTGLGVDVAALRRSVTEVRAAQRAPKTLLDLAQDWKGFSGFVRSIGREPLPATSDTVQLYVAHALRTNKVSTVQRRLWAVTQTHKGAGHRSPVDDDVRALIAAARRKKKEPVKQAIAITADVLRRVCLGMPPGLRGSRDRALLLLGFGAALRSSEICGLDLADVTLRKDGIAVRIASSKTDQVGKGATIAVFAGRRAATDPVRALGAWLKMRGREPGPLFPRVGWGRLTAIRMRGDAVNMLLVEALERVRIDPAGYSGHSLRAGAITAALQQGVPESVVMRQLSRHTKHETLAKYCRRAEEFSVNPLARVL